VLKHEAEHGQEHKVAAPGKICDLVKLKIGSDDEKGPLNRGRDPGTPQQKVRGRVRALHPRQTSLICFLLTPPRRKRRRQVDEMDIYFSESFQVINVALQTGSPPGLRRHLALVLCSPL
jgi:hypothetical protein